MISSPKPRRKTFLAPRPGLAAVLVASCLLTSHTAAGEPGESFVLLKSGGVLRGSVSLADGRYRLVGEGSEIWLQAGEVEQIAESLAQIYEWKRNRCGSLAVDRLGLAQWCIRQQLWPQASRELMEARAADAGHPMLPLIERRLEEAWRRSQAAPTELSPQQIDDQMAEAARAARRLRLVETLPDGALEHFTRRVQPILVNNCTTGGCHQPGGRETFQLNRDWVHGTADRRSTFANLAAVLAAIDENNPDASPLLLAAAQPHGGQTTGTLIGRQAGLQDQLTAWVRGVLQPAAIAEAAPRSRLAAAPTYSGLIGGGFQPAKPVGEAYRYPQPAAARSLARPAAAPVVDPGVQPAEFVETYEPLETGRVRHGAQLRPVAPRDEFDPAIFNRQSQSSAE